MEYLVRDGVSLAYEEAGQGAPPLLLLHGVACDHTHLAPQYEYFRRSHRVVNVDLRGHGASDKPEGEYTLESYVEDVAWLCEALALYRPVLVGHSLGGVVALALAAQRPDLPGAIVMIDSPVVLPDGIGEFLAPVTSGLHSPYYLDTLQGFMAANFHPADSEERKGRILADMAEAPPHVVLATWDDAFSRETDSLAAACQAPALYIDAGAPNCDLARFQQRCPHLVIGRTVGTGHWPQLETPGQVNSMIERFLHLVATPEPAAR